MSIETLRRIKQFIRRDIVGYFAPLIAAVRMLKKPGWNYARQLRVVYRYTFGKRRTRR